MAWVERLVTRTSQPQDAVGVDRTSALAKRFSFVLLPTAGNVNLVNGDVLTKTGTFTNAATQVGVGPNLVGTTADRIGEYGKNSGNVTMPDANSGLTMFAVVVPNTVSTQQTIAAFNRSGFQNTRTRIEISGTGKAAFVIRHLANGTAASVNGLSTLSVGVPYVIVGTSVSQSLHKVYLNGALEAQSATSITGGASDWDSLFVGLDGVSNPGYALPANCKILLCGAARGALSDAEIKSLSDNPWQLLDPEVQRIWVDDFVSAGGGITGTLNANESGSDSGSLSGQVVTQGTLSAAELTGDTVALAGDVIVQGALGATEAGSDTAAISGASVATGTVNASESGSDTAALAGAVIVQGAASASESGADTLASTGLVLVAGALSANEAGSDSAVINGSSVITTTGDVIVSESGSDSAAMTGAVLVQALIAAVETGGDSVQLAGQIIVKGGLSALETGGDTALIYSTVPALHVAGAVTRDARLQGATRAPHLQADSRVSRLQSGSRSSR